MFRLHEYSGKETGLMIIGASQDLLSLGQSLVDYSKDKDNLSIKDWPPCIASVKIENSDYEVSFHHDIDSRSKPKTNRPNFIFWKLTTFLLGVFCGFIIFLIINNF